MPRKKTKKSAGFLGLGTIASAALSYGVPLLKKYGKKVGCQKMKELLNQQCGSTKPKPKKKKKPKTTKMRTKKPRRKKRK